jgi:type IV secretion system protein VirD4
MKRIAKLKSCVIGYLLLLPASTWAQYGLYGNFGPSMMERTPWYQHRIFEHLISLLLGALVGAFFSQKLREFRRWLMAIIFGLSFIIFALLNSILANIGFFIAGFIVAYLALRDKIAMELRRRAAAEKPKTFGSAEWATLAHLQEHELIGEKGFCLGVYEEQGQRHPLQYTGDRHLLTVAPTRSGKGTTALVPNQLTYTGSILVIDPKGENARITAARRGKG